ncbi:hypothetical protein GW764_02825 [Candidatus Parcubacteria bacterium]|nr:hypothetical protein [Candidatus Parcubacteria bacterium]
MEEDNKNNSQIKLIAIVVIVFAVIVAGFMIFNNSGSDKEQVIEEPVNEQEIVYDYINVIYTENGFIPPMVITSESKIKFKNRTSENIELEIRENGSEFSDIIKVNIGGEKMHEFFIGEYTATVVDTEEQIDIRIKN